MNSNFNNDNLIDILQPLVEYLPHPHKTLSYVFPNGYLLGGAIRDFIASHFHNLPFSKPKDYDICFSTHQNLEAVITRKDISVIGRTELGGYTATWDNFQLDFWTFEDTASTISEHLEQLDLDVNAAAIRLSDQKLFHTRSFFKAHINQTISPQQTQDLKGRQHWLLTRALRISQKLGYTLTPQILEVFGYDPDQQRAKNLKLV